MDVEQVIRYFIVHNYVCNADSYTGYMVHNYYLYEEDGKLSMIPWDYNLAFGTFTGGDATETINTPIDTPVSGGSSDRPMLNWIFESEEYTRLYHRYFSEFLSSVDVTGIIDMNYVDASNMTAWIWLAMSIVVLAIGLLIAKLYKH